MDRHGPTSVFALLRQSFTAADALFDRLEGDGSAEAGRDLHRRLSAHSRSHAASVSHLLTVRQVFARGASLLLEAEPEQGPWGFLKAYTGFELLSRALCNHTGPSGLPPGLAEQIEAPCPAPPPDAGLLLPVGAATPALLGFHGADAYPLQPLRKALASGLADWPGLLRLAPPLALAAGRGLPIEPAVCRFLAEALARAATVLLAALTEGTATATPSPTARARQQKPSLLPPSPLPVEPFLARYPGCAPLLYAVAERPWDDAPRLVLADWLEEHGDGPARARAGLIRLQCRQAASALTGERDALGLQAGELLRQHDSVWREGAPRMPRGWSLEFSRGLLEHVTVCEPYPPPRRPRDFVADLEALGAAPLVVRCLRLEYLGGDPSASLPRLAGLPALAGLNALVLKERATFRNSVSALTASSLVGRLASLSLDWALSDEIGPLLRAAGEAGLLRLGSPAYFAGPVAACPQLACLRRLELSDGLSGREGQAAARDLAGSLYLGRLEQLRFEGRLSTASARVLAESTTLASLTQLGLKWGRIGIAGAKALAGGALLAGLVSLGLSHNEIKPEGLKALCRSPHLTKVRVLDLNHNELGDAGVKALAGSELLGRLAFLDLADNGLTDQGARALAGSPAVAHLEELVLWNNAITDEGARALAGSPCLKRLRHLDLRQTRVTAKGARALAGMEGLTAAFFPEGAQAAWWRARGQAEG